MSFLKRNQLASSQQFQTYFTSKSFEFVGGLDVYSKGQLDQKMIDHARFGEPVIISDWQRQKIMVDDMEWPIIPVTKTEIPYSSVSTCPNGNLATHFLDVADLDHVSRICKECDSRWLERR